MARSRLLCSLTLIFLIAVRGATLAAQSTSPSSVSCSDSTPLDDLLTEGKRLAAIEQNAPAKLCFERALAVAVSASDRPSELKARVGIARSAYHLSDYKTAQAEGERASALADALGDQLQAAHAADVRGFVATASGDQASARQHFKRALDAYTALGADAERASVLINLSYTIPAAEPGELEMLNEALAIAGRIGDTDVEARALHARADHAFHAGKYDDAIADLNLAIEKFKASNKPNALANTYVSLGRVYRAHGQPERALEFYDRAAEILEPTGDLRSIVQSINAKAIALGLLGRHKESREAYERALAIARQTGSDRIINFQKGNLAAAYETTGDRPGAIRLLEEVIAVETDPFLLAYRHGNLSMNYAAERRFDTALQHADRAIEYGLKSSNRDYLIDLYGQRASINRQAGRIDPALDDAREAVRRVEDLRTTLVPVDFMKRGFSEVHQSLYGLTLALMIQRGQPEQALTISEQGRARAFLDLLASKNLLATAARPETVTPRPPSSPAVTPATPDASGQPVSAPLSAQVLRGMSSASGATRREELSLSSYASTRTASAEEISATATRLRTTILAYWVDDEEVIAWVVRPGDGVQSARTAVKRAALEGMVQAAIPKPDADDASAYRRLYTLLIAPVAKWLPPAGSALTILPHGPLFRLSFAALADPRGMYLLERYAISYAPSASAFAFTDRLAQQSHQHTDAGSLVVADPAPISTPRGQKPLPALSGAIGEAAAIRDVFGRSQVTVLARNQALEPGVRQQLPDKRVIHFATHAIIRDDEPLDSYLALGESGDSPQSDGHLTVRELYDLSLSSEMVVLSACGTATGKPSGDGISGMSRALFYAGTPSVVATLWDVADQPSAAIMKGFYTHWLGGLDKRAALRRAQLDLLQKLRSGSMSVRTPLGNVRLDARPFYWASYVLIGEPF